MPTGSITGYFDVAQLTLYAFWIFFALLIVYLRREDKREGYPLISDAPVRSRIDLSPKPPTPKTFLLADGEVVYAPRPTETGGVMARISEYPGETLSRSGAPMIDGIGPAAYAERADHPDLGFDDGKPKIVPLRVATAYSIAEEDADPRGMTVIGADRKEAGTVTDAWIDRADMLLRYLEVAVPNGRHVLLPMTLSTIHGKRKRVMVDSVNADQFSDAPGLANPDQVTLREEDRISAYFASGHLYANPQRMGPLL